MAKLKQTIVPHLWFDREAIEAATFYTSIFADSRITNTRTLYDTPSGTVDLVSFELMGQEFMAISAGPLFKFNESISFVVKCENQEEVDYYWKAFCKDGGEEVECGWLKDKFGLSRQVVPTIMDEMMTKGSREQRDRVTQAFLKMKKFDIDTLREAYEQTTEH